MGLYAYLSCNRTDRYGVCAATSLPAGSERLAIDVAVSAGWYFRHGRHGDPDHALCPAHSGRDQFTRPTPPHAILGER